MDIPPPNFLSHKTKAKAKATARLMNSKHRPLLHSCGVSMLAIVDIAIGKAQHINGPIGSTLKRLTKLAKLATPLIYAMQFQLLTILSFIDHAILAIEKIAEKLCPASTRVFDKVDEIVLMIVSLPEKFDGAMNKFPTMIHEVPFIAISRLNSLVSTLNHWGEENSRVNEKTIGVDRSCNEEYIPMDDNININENLEIFPPIVSECELEHKEENPNEKIEKECEFEKKIDDDCECECEEGREKNDEKSDDAIVKCQVGGTESVKDPLLELFESAWLMKAR